jgi:hypothetical protein
MKQFPNPFTWFLGFGVLVVLFVAGCSSKPKERDPDKSEENLKRIGQAYRDAGLQLHRPPANLQDIKPYLMKYGDPEELLRSPNDGQPYDIVWRITPLRFSPGVTHIKVLAHEHTSANSKRYILDVMLKTRSMTDEEFATVEFPKGHSRS